MGAAVIDGGATAESEEGNLTAGAPGETGLTAEEATTAALRQTATEGIILSLTEDKDHILAGPRDLLTDELRGLIREAHDGLIRQLLFREALAYYQRHLDHAGGGSSKDASRSREYHERLANDDTRLGEAWMDASIQDFKKILRGWLKGRLRAYHETAATDEAGTENSSGQPTLLEVK